MNLSTRGSKKSRARCTRARGLLRLIPIPIERAPWEFRKTNALVCVCCQRAHGRKIKFWLSRAAGAFCSRIFFGVWAGSEKDIFLSKCCSRGDESLPGHAAYNFTPRRAFAAAPAHKSIRNSYMELERERESGRQWALQEISAKINARPVPLRHFFCIIPLLKTQKSVDFKRAVNSPPIYAQREAPERC
jgi:hypothetical protein